MLLFFHSMMVVFFTVLGIVFLNGKGAFLIAGYNTASAMEKAETDEKKLCRFMGKFTLVLAACRMAAVASDIWKSTALLWAGIVLFVLAALGGVVYAGTGERFRRSE